MVKYLARPENEESRLHFIKPFQDALVTADGQTPLADDENRRKRIVELLVAEIRGLGDGNERGIDLYSLLSPRMFLLTLLNRNRGILQFG